MCRDYLIIKKVHVILDQPSYVGLASADGVQSPSISSFGFGPQWVAGWFFAIMLGWRYGLVGWHIIGPNAYFLSVIHIWLHHGHT